MAHPAEIYKILVNLSHGFYKVYRNSYNTDISGRGSGHPHGEYNVLCYSKSKKLLRPACSNCPLSYKRPYYKKPCKWPWLLWSVSVQLTCPYKQGKTERQYIWVRVTMDIWDELESKKEHQHVYEFAIPFFALPSQVASFKQMRSKRK